MPIAAEAASKTLTISGSPARTVAVNGNYSFQPAAKDTVKSRIKFDIYNKPSWASFDGVTGRLYGTPNRNQVGSYQNITIRLTDWYGFVTTAPFSITVTAPPPVAQPVSVNSAPTLSGTAPQVVNTGAFYQFKPKATDSNGDKLTFSIQNAPRWAKFDVTSGTLAGTPAAADAGTYANIQISVSDGKTRVALPAFKISVEQVYAGNVTVDWTPPTDNSDGSILSDLAGYKVSYGTDPANLTQVIKVANAGLSSLVVDDLAPGTWYFSVSSYNGQGVDSPNSGVVATKVL
jgi:Putative Ig domain